jgi:hypothetical protein
MSTTSKSRSAINSTSQRGTQYEVTRTLPVARFYYQGHHSHPVRRTILVIESTKNHLRGYELREGSMVRGFSRAPIKNYRKDMIASGEELRSKTTEQTTLKRMPLFDLIQNGA